MKLLILSCLLPSTTFAFVPVVLHPPSTCTQPLFSTLVDHVPPAEEDIQLKRNSDSSWVSKQFDKLTPKDVVTDLQTTTTRTAKKQEEDNDWFHYALEEVPNYVTKNLQVDEKKSSLSSALLERKSSFPGIVPTVPPTPASFDSLKNDHLMPTDDGDDDDGPVMMNAFLRHRGDVEWFSQTSPSVVESAFVVNHNQLKQGANEWFSQEVL